MGRWATVEFTIMLVAVIAVATLAIWQTLGV